MSLSVIQKARTLITRRKNPRVIRLNGKAKKERIVLTMLYTMAQDPGRKALQTNPG